MGQVAFDVAFDVDVDGAEEVDVLAVCRRDVGKHLFIDAPPGPAHRFHCQAVVSRCKGHHGVRDKREAPCLFGLLFEVTGPDSAFMGVEQIPFQGVQ